MTLSPLKLATLLYVQIIIKRPSFYDYTGKKYYPFVHVSVRQYNSSERKSHENLSEGVSKKISFLKSPERNKIKY